MPSIIISYITLSTKLGVRKKALTMVGAGIKTSRSDAKKLISNKDNHVNTIGL